MNLIIEAHGGLGDQVCLEPVARFITKKWPHYKLHIATHYPELFSHLPVNAINGSIKLSEPAGIANTHPKNDTVIDFQQIHTIDYISLRLLRMILPPEDKQIKISVPHEADTLAEGYLGCWSETVVVHAGSGWQSKTFPKEVWQSYIDAILDAGLQVALVGKNYWANNKDRRGVVEGLDTSRCIDLVDKLSMIETCAVLSYCPALLSNDSGLIHVSGAFNNHVGVISTVRRPETLAHWRYGQQGYRYTFLEKNRIYDRFIPDSISGILTHNLHSIDEKDLLEAMPDIETVVKWAERSVRDYNEN